MFERFVERRAQAALSDTPVVLIVGPRRAGKTTLVRKMGEAGRTYLTLDDPTVIAAARSDPVGFVRGLDRASIDEIQRAPDLLLAIKKTVDEDYRPGPSNLRLPTRRGRLSCTSTCPERVATTRDCLRRTMSSDSCGVPANSSAEDFRARARRIEAKFSALQV